MTPAIVPAGLVILRDIDRDWRWCGGEGASLDKGSAQKAITCHPARPVAFSGTLESPHLANVQVVVASSAGTVGCSRLSHCASLNTGTCEHRSFSNRGSMQPRALLITVQINVERFQCKPRFRLLSSRSRAFRDSYSPTRRVSRDHPQVGCGRVEFEFDDAKRPLQAQPLASTAELERARHRLV